MRQFVSFFKETVITWLFEVTVCESVFSIRNVTLTMTYFNGEIILFIGSYVNPDRGGIVSIRVKEVFT